MKITITLVLLVCFLIISLQPTLLTLAHASHEHVYVSNCEHIHIPECANKYNEIQEPTLTKVDAQHDNHAHFSEAGCFICVLVQKTADQLRQQYISKSGEMPADGDESSFSVSRSLSEISGFGSPIELKTKMNN